MRYTVTIAGRELEVQVDGDRVRLNGDEVAARLVPVSGTPLRQLHLNGRSHMYVVQRDGDGWSLGRCGEVASAVVEDERTKQLKQLTGGTGSKHRGGVVRAPMPGLVVRVSVQEGQEISAGASVVVLEAMKMENEIAAPVGGTVKSVGVEPGQAVEKGAVLVEVSSEP